jgi:signal transduction histidine kinase
MSMGVLGPINDKQKTTLNEVVGSGKHLLALINDVLDMSKIQGGMLNLFLEEDVSLNEILNTVAGTAASLIGDKPVMLIRDEDALPPILCDKRRIQQVLLNLISNAAKFTHDGTITVSAKCQRDQLLFAVIDTGPGIASKDKEIIFQPFQQTETGIKHAGGTGLGLPISRNLIEAHGGELWVESEVGRGAAFIFTLPLHSPKLQEMLHDQMGANHA